MISHSKGGRGVQAGMTRDVGRGAGERKVL